MLRKISKSITRRGTLFLLLLVSNACSAHQDFWMVRFFDNVKVRIKTGFKYEEIQNAWIIGELSNRLCKELGYTKSVFIDFEHHYVGECDPDYFLSFDDGLMTRNGIVEKSNSLFNPKKLVVRTVSRKFSALNTLKLLEYSIIHEDLIRKTQKEILYNQNYCQWRLKSIDTTRIKQMVEQVESEMIKKVITTRVYRNVNGSGGDEATKASYFYQNNQYQLFIIENLTESVVLELKNIYQFVRINSTEAVVFDTDSSFYYIANFNTHKLSSRKIITQTKDNFQPFDVLPLEEGKILVSFWHYNTEGGIQPKEKKLIYDPGTDVLRVL